TTAFERFRTLRVAQEQLGDDGGDAILVAGVAQRPDVQSDGFWPKQDPALSIKVGSEPIFVSVDLPRRQAELDSRVSGTETGPNELPFEPSKYNSAERGLAEELIAPCSVGVRPVECTALHARRV